MKNTNSFPTRNIPVIPTRNTVVFPETTVPLMIGRKLSVNALLKAQQKDQWVLLVAAKTDKDNADVSVEDLRLVGTLGQIERIDGDATHGYRAMIRGISRFAVDHFTASADLISASGQLKPDVIDVSKDTLDSLISNMKSIIIDVLKLLPQNTKSAQDIVQNIENPETLTSLCAQYLDLSMQEKQELLENTNFRNRALRILDLLVKRKEELQLQQELDRKLNSKMGKLHRETILREQMKAIQEELGEGRIATGHDKDYRKLIENAGMPADIKSIALDHLQNLENLSPQSHERSGLKNYLDLLTALPWSKTAESNIDLNKAREILDKEHFGLDEVKKRIVQYLAVMKMKNSKKGSILLLVGPPGVGKTSLGQSIAHALDRKFVRAALGGVRDDAEIRGHRRTYVGSMPGRIIEGIKRAGENNPVFMLDEIDKLTRGWGGDPSSALLETLDPEQNHTFMDHYLDVPFDLSNVFFIATANNLESIPAPLLDRMEVIQLSGYTPAEKLHIAKNHLVPKQLLEHGLTSDKLQISEDVLLKIISSYTRESGVRDLQRKIANLCRASAEKVLTSAEGQIVTIDVSELKQILGREKFSFNVAEHAVPAGVATGLAWTPMGGDILFIESSLMPGTGKLTLTGQLGDVMKESAHIALSLVRSHLSALVSDFEIDKKDIHVHVPAGAIPKDGPSAGVTMLTTLASLLTKIPVHSKLAMTGEITLRGAVTPVGGIKEKVIAAHRAGIETIIMAKKNEDDLADVPQEVQKAIKFHFVETVDEVLKIALGLQTFQVHSTHTSNDLKFCKT
jgi:ATP-dependent Lon protease